MKARKRKRRGIIKAVLTVMLSFAIEMGMIPGTDIVIPAYAVRSKVVYLSQGINLSSKCSISFV